MLAARTSPRGRLPAAATAQEDPVGLVQARITDRFGKQLKRLTAAERDKFDLLLGDMRMAGSDNHQSLGNPRKYRMGAWVRDIPVITGGNAGKLRLIYTDVTKDAREVAAGHSGHVDVLGIGDPHDGSGFGQVNTLADVAWW